MEIKAIAHIENDFTEKFGIPRQSGLIPAVKSRIVFEPEYRIPEALRGLSDYSHIWLIWEFSHAVRRQKKQGTDPGWSPTVRPPRLGGNVHMGVFATRSPFRPNPLGLSCVALDRIESDPSLGPVLYVTGADLMNGTPIYDIKPYLPYADAYPDALGGFTDHIGKNPLTVHCAPELLKELPPDTREALMAILAEDPRPSYQKDPERVYGFTYAGREVRFQVNGQMLTVVAIH